MALLSGRALAQSVVQAPHVEVSLLTERAVGSADQSMWVALRFKIAKGWHLYWRNPGSAGKAPTVQWQGSQGGQVTAEALQWPTPTQFMQGQLTGFGYGAPDEASEPLLLAQRLHIQATDKLVTLKAQVRWLICADTCVPGSALLENSFEVAAPGVLAAQGVNRLDAQAIEQSLARLPRPLPPTLQAALRTAATRQGQRITVALLDPSATFNPAQWQAAQLFPAANGVVPSHPAEPQPSGGLVAWFLAPSLDAGDSFEGVLRVGEQAFTLKIPYGAAPLPEPSPLPKPSSLGPVPSEPLSLWRGLIACLGAFLGGLILNVMPCVFPVLAMKALSLIHLVRNRPAARLANAGAYTAGIVLSFLGLAGVMLVIKATGGQLGWGFQLQSPLFVAALVTLLFTMALNMLGVFEFTLSLRGIRPQAAHSSEAKTFDGRALRHSFLSGILATVVATPCTAPFMGTALGLAMSESAPIALLIFLCLALGMALPMVVLMISPRLIGFLPKPGEWMVRGKQFLAFPLLATAAWLAWIFMSETSLRAGLWLLLSLVLMGLGLWLIGFVRGRPARLVAAILLLGAGALQLQAAQRATLQRDALNWQPYSEAALNEALAAQRPVLIDFTAAWCVTCQLNEAAALQDTQVVRHLMSQKVITLKADYTQQDDAITRALARYGRSGVPLYVYYPAGQNPAPQLLPQILTPSIVLQAVR